MLQLGKCAKDNSKIFLSDKKVSKLSFGNKFKIQPKIFNKKDEETCLDFVLHEKSPSYIALKKEKKI